MATVELRFSPLPAHVRTARLIAAAVARRTSVDEAVVDEIKLAVGEACSRAVGLHRERDRSDDVVVTLSDDGAFVVAVRDRAPTAAGAVENAAMAEALDTLVNPVDDADDGALVAGALPPGFGLAMIAGLVDDLRVDSGDDGTVVRMRWPLRGDGS